MTCNRWHVYVREFNNILEREVALVSWYNDRNIIQALTWLLSPILQIYLFLGGYFVTLITFRNEFVLVLTQSGQDYLTGHHSKTFMRPIYISIYLSFWKYLYISNLEVINSLRFLAEFVCEITLHIFEFWDIYDEWKPRLYVYKTLLYYLDQ